MGPAPVGRGTGAPPLRLLVDARWVDVERADGITRYTHGLVGALSQRADVEVTLLTSADGQRRGFEHLPHLAWNHPTSPAEPATGLRLRRHRFDAVFCPHFLFGGWGLGAPRILSVLDLIPYHHPMAGRLRWRLFFSNRRFLRLLLRQAAGVATLNASIHDELRSDTDRPLGVVAGAPSVLPDPSPDAAPPGGRLVYMGRYDEYKDVETLIAGLAHLPDHELVLLGSMRPERRASLEAAVPAGARVTFRGPVTDQEYADALAGATALVTASREEGFGLPVVESMAAGTPVACADTPVFREVAGEAAAFFPIGDAAGLAAAVRRLEEAGPRAEAIARGRERAASFTWAASADALVRFVLACAPHLAHGAADSRDAAGPWSTLRPMRRGLQLHERNFGPAELLAREVVKGVINHRGERGQIVRARSFDALRRLTPYASVVDGDLCYLVNTRDRIVSRATYAARGFDLGVMQDAIAACEAEGFPQAGKAFVDIGANIGVTTMPALRRFGFTRAVSFEPAPDNLRLLRANLALNDLTDQVDLFPIALGSEAGTASLGLSPTNPGDHRIRDHDEGREVVEVPVEAFDDLVADGRVDLGDVGMVWMDVQGYEARVLAGASSILDAGLPLVTEYWPEQLTRIGDLADYKAAVLGAFGRVLDLRTGQWHEGPAMERFLDSYAEKVWLTDLLFLPARTSAPSSPRPIG